PLSVSLKGRTYTPESAFGVFRLPEDKWDCLLDRKYKIGYIRLGPIESGLDVRFGDMMAELTRQGCRALVLDLRWCPGGYVDPGTRIAGMFLKDGSVIAKMEYRNPQRAGSASEIRTPAGGGKYADLPLVLLVGHETAGREQGAPAVRPRRSRPVPRRRADVPAEETRYEEVTARRPEIAATFADDRSVKRMPRSAPYAEG